MSASGIVAAVLMGAALLFGLLALLEAIFKGFGRGCFMTIGVLLTILAVVLLSCNH